MSARKPKQSESLPIAIDAPTETRDTSASDTSGTPDGKTKPGTSGPVLDWNLPPCDDYAVWVIGFKQDGTHSKPIQPDFEPRDFNVKTTANKANGNHGAKQAMWGRAGLFAGNERIAGAFVVRSANKAKGTGVTIWRVLGNGGGVKEVERIEIEP